MAVVVTYSSIFEKIKSEGGLEKALAGKNKNLGGFGNEGGNPDESGGAFNPQALVGSSIEIEFQPLPVIDYPMDDQQFQGTTTTTKVDLNKLLSIKPGGKGGLFVNNYLKGEGQAILNASRIIVNASEDYLMLFGTDVAIASSGNVNIDAAEQVVIYGETGLYLGVPNKGEEWNENVPQPPKDKGDPIPNNAYEPLVLGFKLANLLDDILFVLKNANIITTVGQAYFLEDTQHEFRMLADRIPEILSTFAYVDGVSHDKAITPKAPPPEKVTAYPTKLIGTITAMGPSQTGVDPNATPVSPITSPLKDLPGFYESTDGATVTNT